MNIILFKIEVKKRFFFYKKKTIKQVLHERIIGNFSESNLENLQKRCKKAWDNLDHQNAKEVLNKEHLISTSQNGDNKIFITLDPSIPNTNDSITVDVMSILDGDNISISTGKAINDAKKILSPWNEPGTKAKFNRNDHIKLFPTRDNDIFGRDVRIKTLFKRVKFGDSANKVRYFIALSFIPIGFALKNNSHVGIAEIFNKVFQLGVGVVFTEILLIFSRPRFNLSIGDIKHPMDSNSSEKIISPKEKDNRKEQEITNPPE